MDKSARQVQGGLTTSSPTATSPATKPVIGLKPPAAMTPEERKAAGIGDPPPDLMARYLKPTREPGEDETEQLENADSNPARPAKAPSGTLPPDWEATPEGIDQAGTTLAMKRLPFEEDPDYARRIHARLNLG